MLTPIVAFFSGIFQLAHTGLQISFLSKNNNLNNIFNIVLGISFCLLNVLFGLKTESSGILLINTFLIATVYFYQVFMPLVLPKNSDASLHLILIISGGVVTFLLKIFLDIVFGMSHGAVAIQIPFILTIYYVIASVTGFIRILNSTKSVWVLFWKGVIVLTILALIAVNFTLENPQSVFLLNMNLFYLTFVFQFWSYRFQVNSERKKEEAKKEMKDYGLKSFGLTEMELAIARHYLDGKDPQKTADALGVSKNSVNTHASNLYRKTNTVDRTSLVLKFYNSRK